MATIFRVPLNELVIGVDLGDAAPGPAKVTSEIQRAFEAIKRLPQSASLLLAYVEGRGR
jgi:hypothetical protein